jgi:hypothetical protein
VTNVPQGSRRSGRAPLNFFPGNRRLSGIELVGGLKPIVGGQRFGAGRGQLYFPRKNGSPALCVVVSRFSNGWRMGGEAIPGDRPDQAKAPAARCPTFHAKCRKAGRRDMAGRSPTVDEDRWFYPPPPPWWQRNGGGGRPRVGLGQASLPDQLIYSEPRGDTPARRSARRYPGTLLPPPRSRADGSLNRSARKCSPRSVSEMDC